MCLLRHCPPNVELRNSYHGGGTREVIASRVLKRKVLLQQYCDLLDTVQHTGLIIALLEMSFHGLANRLPFAAVHPGVYAPVDDNFDVPVRKKQIDENAVVVLGVPDPQVRENLDGTVPRRDASQQGSDVQRPLYSKPDLTDMRAMTCTDSLFNRD